MHVINESVDQKCLHDGNSKKRCFNYLNIICVELKSFFDILIKLWDLDDSRLHPGGNLVFVIPVLKSKGDQSKEDADKDDNEDTTNVVDGDTSSILIIFFAGLVGKVI